MRISLIVLTVGMLLAWCPTSSKAKDYVVEFEACSIGDFSYRQVLLPSGEITVEIYESGEGAALSRGSARLEPAVIDSFASIVGLHTGGLPASGRESTCSERLILTSEGYAETIQLSNLQPTQRSLVIDTLELFHSYASDVDVDLGGTGYTYSTAPIKGGTYSSYHHWLLVVLSAILLLVVILAKFDRFRHPVLFLLLVCITCDLAHSQASKNRNAIVLELFNGGEILYSQSLDSSGILQIERSTVDGDVESSVRLEISDEVFDGMVSIAESIERSGEEHFAQRHLSARLTVEDANGKVRVVPLDLAHPGMRELLLNYSSMLANYALKVDEFDFRTIGADEEPTIRDGPHDHVWLYLVEACLILCLSILWWRGLRPAPDRRTAQVE